MWLVTNWSTVSPMLVQHIWLAVLPTLFGLAIALPLGMFLRTRRRGRAFAVAASSLIYTIPSLALFVLIPSVLGTQFLDPANVVIALTLYSASLCVRSVLESLDEVPEGTREAATAIGFAPWRRTALVDLPLVIPVLAASTRVAAVANVSMVSVGAVIGVGGLGKMFTDGYQRNFPEEILWGIVLILLLAVCLDRTIALVAHGLTPWNHERGLAASAKRLRALSRELPESARLQEAVRVR